MRTKQFLILAFVMAALSSCMKHASDYKPGYGEIVNTWMFTDGSSQFFGKLYGNAILHSTPQSNNTYLLEMTGVERAGQQLALAISFLNPEVTTGTFQSGIAGSDHETAFYYSGSAASRDPLYASTNNNPGAVMSFVVTHFDATNRTATIEFSGEAFDMSGNKVNITRGKLTAKVDIQ